MTGCECLNMEKDVASFGRCEYLLRVRASIPWASDKPRPGPTCPGPRGGPFRRPAPGRPLGRPLGLALGLVRTFLLGVYRVDSASMEPYLHGDPRDGEWVLVRYSKSPRLERLDPVVLLRPGELGGYHCW